VLFEGYSNGACIAYGFSRLHGERVIGFLAEKACTSVNQLPIGLLARSVPAYFVIGEHDLQNRITNTTALFESNRSQGAPWALAVEVETGHQRSLDFDLIYNWLDAVLALRLPETNTPTLRPIDQTSGWLGDRDTFNIAEYSCFDGDKLEASWLPSETTAHNWQLMASAGNVTTVIPCGNAY
jgi:hypothetical protein